MQTVLPTQSDLKQKLFHKQTQIVSDQQKYPQLFKWKTGSLIMGSLAAILLIVLGVVLYNIESQPQNKIDLTFLKPIILSTQILKNNKQIINLAYNFQQIYGTTKFQQAQLLQRTSQLNEGMIRNSIYGKQNQKLLYLVQLQHKKSQNTTQDIRFAIYMNSPFPMPQDDDYQPTQTYYSFQVKQQRKSSLLSLITQQTLKLYSTNPQIKSIAQCKNYKFQPINQDRPIGTFRLLNDLINFNFENQNVRFNVKGWQCFTPDLDGEEAFRAKLYEIVGVGEIEEGETLVLKRLEVYHLR